ncbi:MAG: hypothetical protein R3194_06930, partial [Limnobacter sp.]|nr:hypothetical protein [Limnobacter sp.]
MIVVIRIAKYLSVLSCVLFVPLASAQERLVIEFSDRAVPPGLALSAAKTPQKVKDLHAMVTELGKAPTQMVRTFGDRALIVSGSGQAIAQLERRLASDPAVAWTARDRRIKPSAQSPLIGLINTLDPTLAPRSWHHRAVSDQAASMNTFEMWNLTHGSA